MGTTNFDAVSVKDGFYGPIGGDAPSIGTFTYSAQSVADALTATGTTRATSLSLAAAINVLSTVASGTGVTLPDAPIGSTVIVFNAGANAAKVYADGSQTIDGTSGSTGVTLTNALRCTYTRTTTNKWLSAQLGVASA